MLQDSTSLTAPPSGFDSVCFIFLISSARVSNSLLLFTCQVLAEKGGSLNYDELVVYHNDSIRPSFLVMYDEP